MKKFTPLVEKGDKWYIGYCPEFPGANGQGRSLRECIDNLADVVELLIEDMREDACELRRG